MKLVIAEKNSVAQSLARVIGAIKRCDGYYEGNGYLVTWCVGHLVELSPPERYDECFAKWRLDDLPILPEKWLYEVSAATRKQFRIVSALMNAEWEQKLLQVEHGELEGNDFMSGIEGIIANLVTTYEKMKGADALMSRNLSVGTCPHCGAEVLERQHRNKKQGDF